MTVLVDGVAAGRRQLAPPRVAAVAVLDVEARRANSDVLVVYDAEKVEYALMLVDQRIQQHQRRVPGAVHYLLTVAHALPKGWAQVLRPVGVESGGLESDTCPRVRTAGR